MMKIDDVTALAKKATDPAKPEAFDLGLELASKTAFANDKQAEAGLRGSQGGERVDEEVEPFLGLQPPDRANHDFIVGDPKALTDLSCA
jgi:hypothetical protein